MPMSKKHYNQFANLIHGLRAKENEKFSDFGRLDADELVTQLCLVLKQDNPNFRSQQFIDACGGLTNGG